MNTAFKDRIKINSLWNRSSRRCVSTTLNVDNIQTSDTNMMIEDEHRVQGMDVIVLGDYDKDSNDGDTFVLELTREKKSRRSVKGKGARGNNVVNMYDEEDIFHDFENESMRYQFAFDLKFKDKNSVF